jgi:hypothetical protein
MNDSSRAYHAGVVQVGLNHAAAALTDAFVSALAVEDYDSPLVQAIIRAQDNVKTAQRAPIDWHA